MLTLLRFHVNNAGYRTTEATSRQEALAALYVSLIPLFAPTGRYREYLDTAERVRTRPKPGR